MNEAFTAQAFMRMAGRALASAQLLLTANDAEGACNRAYYAMFDAANSALIYADPDRPATRFKTHRGLIAAFGLHLVQGNFIDASHGNALNRVEKLRLLADYTGEPVSQEDAEWAVTQAKAFLAAVRLRFSQDAPGNM